ncbi:hypothetical protein PQS31_06170 [Luteimonas sp BLCC-B24]|uniref:hypothetical protein n=1 Tax=Luteimonas sp. BLCC-B24 TaxID=3025317 RepID=UPI00234D1C47|nr:hypothetical protein [Luteimonas sp. BLCC-B24]MDC7806409.1 hypothetical protein [Luteimonas sp. BLCC-B24]
MTTAVDMGFREFADHLGCKPGYVTELRKAGRLVLTDDGKRVRVAESRQLIEDTRDPRKAGVAARHAGTRGALIGPAGPALDSADDGADDDDEALATSGPSASHAARRAKAAADREEALARKALRDEQVELGTLLVIDEVVSAIATTVTTLRTGLQNLRATLAPSLAAAQTEEQVGAILGEAIESALDECARELRTLGKDAQA